MREGVNWVDGGEQESRLVSTYQKKVTFATSAFCLVSMIITFEYFYQAITIHGKKCQINYRYIAYLYIGERKTELLSKEVIQYVIRSFRFLFSYATKWIIIHFIKQFYKTRFIYIYLCDNRMLFIGDNIFWSIKIENFKQNDFMKETKHLIKNNI